MIEVELIRISADSTYLELIVNCPAGFIFNRLEVKRYDYTPVDENDSGWIDLSEHLEGDTVREVKRINCDLLGGCTMFYVNLGIRQEPFVQGVSPEPETMMAVCSNINDFYFCAHDKIQALENKEIPRAEYELLVRWYFALYAHKEAIRLERYDDAERYYDILKDIIVEAGWEKREFETRNFTL